MPHRIAVKDLKEMLKEKTFVSVIILLLFVAGFSSVLTFGLLILYNPDAVGVSYTAKVAVVNNLSATDVCKIGRCMSLKDAVTSFNRGDTDAVVIFDKLGDKIYARLILPENEVKSLQALLYLKKKLVEYEKRLRDQIGIPDFHVRVYLLNDGEVREVRIPEGSSAIFRFIYLILIPLLAITTAVIAAGMTIDSVCEEMERNTIELLLASPVSAFRLSVGKILAPLILSSILIFLWLLLLILNRVDIYNFPMVFIHSLSLSSVFIALAYITSLYMRDRERSQFVFSLIAASLLPALISLRVSPAVMAGRIASGADGVGLVPVILILIPFIVAKIFTVDSKIL